ncbi:MAG: hypothetical protein FK734_05095 [Asgard group archaeon]|nr:hypothetical protein [Asgard group archaeon]
MELDHNMELTQEDLFYLEDLLTNIKKSVSRLERFIEIKRSGLLETQEHFTKKYTDGENEKEDNLES